MYRLAMACNDHRNGSYTGHVSTIHIADSHGDVLLLAGDRPLSCGVSRSPNSNKLRNLRIGHLRLRLHSYSTWVGNWCWDEATLDTDDLAKVVNYLRKRGWHCEGGYAELFNKYESGAEFMSTDFKQVKEGE